MTKKLLLPADINTRANNSSIDQAVILSARPIFNSLLRARLRARSCVYARRTG